MKGFYYASWALYIVGFALVVGGWIGLVSGPVSWCGWLVGMAGWGMQFMPWYPNRRKRYELAQLERLRADGSISDEAYEAEKSRIAADRRG